MYAAYLVDHDLNALFHRPALRLAYLQRQRLRAARLVIDTGLHGLGWTVAKAAAYLQIHSDLAPEDIEREWLRCLAQPGRAAAALTGFLFLRDLRRAAREELGSDFFLQAFHDALLYQGALPPDELKTATLARLKRE